MIPLLIIKTENLTQLVYHDRIENLCAQSLSSWFHSQCLSHGTTLKGSMDAMRFHLKIRQKIPVCLSVIQGIMYFPLNLQDCEVWILYHAEYTIKRCGVYAILTVHHLSFKLPLDPRVIKRQFLRCRQYLESFQRVPTLKNLSHVYESLVSQYLI
jgi:hypothetical protein